MCKVTYGAPVDESKDVERGKKDEQTTSHAVVLAVVRRSTRVRLDNDRFGGECELGVVHG